MKDGQAEQHEEEVYHALYKYFDKILLESGYIGTVLELGNEIGDDDFNKWAFEEDRMSGCFMFTLRDFEVYATPFFEYAEGIPYVIYKDGEPFIHDSKEVYGTIPIIVTGNSQVDVDTYIGLIDDLLEKYDFGDSVV